jgi:inhibitor of cysteine peptidase
MSVWRMWVSLGLLVAVAALAVGVSPARAAVSAQREVAVSAENNGGTITLAPGDDLTVTLDGNPTTGYLWEVSGKLDATVLKSQGEPAFQVESGLEGAGGLQTNRFEAVGPGQVKLTMVYHRPWEKNAKPDKTFVVTVNVEATQPPREIHLTDTDSGAALDMIPGDQVILTLPANPTTGFGWEARTAPDAAVLAPQGQPVFAPESDLMGAPGTETRTYQAAGPGRTQLDLIYRRTLDLVTAPSHVFTATVTVKPAVAPTLTLTDKDRGHTVELKVGQRMMLLLAGNPTTGYLWQVDPKVDTKVIRAIGEPGFHQDSNLIGAGGTETFLLEAVVTGTTQLSLSYGQPWEPNVKPAKTFTVKITVH